MKAWVALFLCVILACIHLSTSRHSVATGGLVEGEEKTVNESKITVPTILNKFKISGKKSITIKKLKHDGPKKPNLSKMLYTTGDKNNVWSGNSDSEKQDEEKESRISDSSSNDQSSTLKDDSEHNSTSGQTKHHRRFHRWYSIRKHNFKKFFKRHGRNMTKLQKHHKNKFGKTDSSLSAFTSDNDNNDGKYSNDQSSSSKADHDHGSSDDKSGHMSHHSKFYQWYLEKKHSFGKYFKKHLKNYHHGNSTLNTSGEIKRKKLRSWFSEKKKALGKSWQKHKPALKKFWHSNRRKIKVMWFSFRMWYRYHRHPKINAPNMPSRKLVGAGSMNRNLMNDGNNRRVGGRRRY